MQDGKMASAIIKALPADDTEAISSALRLGGAAAEVSSTTLCSGGSVAALAFATSCSVCMVGELSLTVSQSSVVAFFWHMSAQTMLCSGGSVAAFALAMSCSTWAARNLKSFDSVTTRGCACRLSPAQKFHHFAALRRKHQPLSAGGCVKWCASSYVTVIKIRVPLPEIQVQHCLTCEATSSCKKDRSANGSDGGACCAACGCSCGSPAELRLHVMLQLLMNGVHETRCLHVQHPHMRGLRRPL